MEHESTEQALPQTILEEAAEITAGDRQKFYGHPRDNHGNTAEFWTAYLKRKYGAAFALDAEDVCFFMALLKVSRQCNRPKRDNLVDIAGYIRNAEMVTEPHATPSPPPLPAPAPPGAAIRSSFGPDLDFH